MEGMYLAVMEAMGDMPSVSVERGREAREGRVEGGNGKEGGRGEGQSWASREATMRDVRGRGGEGEACARDEGRSKDELSTEGAGKGEGGACNSMAAIETPAMKIRGCANGERVRAERGWSKKLSERRWWRTKSTKGALVGSWYEARGAVHGTWCERPGGGGGGGGGGGV